MKEIKLSIRCFMCKADLMTAARASQDSSDAADKATRGTPII